MIKAMTIENNDSLPPGWRRTEKIRKNGNRTDVYLYSPDGTLFRSKKQLANYIKENKLHYDVERFNFSLKQVKTCSNNTSGVESHEKTNADLSIDNLCIEQRSEATSITEVSFPSEFQSSDNEDEMNQSVLALSESLLQLQYEKEKTEESLANIEQEAEIALASFEEKVNKLHEENFRLKKQLKNKEEELIGLKDSMGINSLVVNINEVKSKDNCGKCEILKQDILMYRKKITQIQKENLKLMETILPCPLPDETLKEELRVKDIEIKNLQKEAKEDMINYEAILTSLMKDIENINSDNYSLRSENVSLKKQLEELADEKKFVTVKSKSGCIPKHNEDRGGNGSLFLSNSFDVLSESGTFNMDSADGLQDAKHSQHCKIDQKIDPERKINKSFDDCGTHSMSKNKTKKIVILADSHGRHLRQNLNDVWPNSEYSISCIFKPNAKTADIIKETKTITEGFTKDDTLVWIGGSNDEIVHGEKQLINEIKHLLNGTIHTKVIISGLPYRHHNPGVNNRICFVNMDILKIVEEYDHASFLAINELPRVFYTRHGIHFNRQGKMKIALMIRDMFLSKTTTEISTLQGLINVREANMWDVINKKKKDPTTAFAHSISSDIQHHRNMTAGVAVLFRKQFGRPKPSDLVDTRLACQGTESGAKVYSLITKANYSDKPTNEDYDEAFEQLARDFKKKNLRKLICSPMGCARDFIKLQHFTRNITKFQQETKACVQVIVYDQPFAKRKLWKGLPFPVFVEQLCSILRREIPNTEMTDVCLTTPSTSLKGQYAERCTEDSLRSCIAEVPDSPGASRIVPGPLSYSEVLKSTPVHGCRFRQGIITDGRHTSTEGSTSIPPSVTSVSVSSASEVSNDHFCDSGSQPDEDESSDPSLNCPVHQSLIPT